MSLQSFIDAYIECALWCTTDDNEEPLDVNYDQSGLAGETLEQITEDCKNFYCANALMMPQHGTDEQCGHDFWLTRNHHGAGFWDRGTGEVGERLTKAAHAYGSYDLYVGDDNQIYGA